MTSRPTLADHAGKNDKTAEKSVLIVGCGYLGLRVALAAKSAENRIWVTTRRRKRAEQLASLGLEPLIVDWTDRRSLQSLPDADRILVAVSYDRNSRHNRYQSQVGGLRNLIRSIGPSPNLCYISTTGVYHQTDRRWVDEASPTRPSRQGGQVHLQAEQLLHRLRPESPWTILRLAGIYGPGRVPRVADVIAGKVIRSPSEGYLNLIHVSDATRAVLATWQKPCERLYVVADDNPVIRGEFYREIARQCGAPPPQFGRPTADDPVSMRSLSNKRVWNRRFKRDLIPELCYPGYRQGLDDVLQST